MNGKENFSLHLELLLFKWFNKFRIITPKKYSFFKTWIIFMLRVPTNFSLFKLFYHRYKQKASISWSSKADSLTSRYFCLQAMSSKQNNQFIISIIFSTLSPGTSCVNWLQPLHSNSKFLSQWHSENHKNEFNFIIFDQINF